MKRIGDFYDTVIQKDYDLYTMNAIELKKYVANSYNLNPLKINMFNSSSSVMDDVETETRYSNLLVDYEKGTINNFEDYTEYKAKEGRSDYRYNLIKDATENTENVNNKTNDYHLLGFELSPIAISLKNKDISELSNVELLDGFKRMFWTMNVPDIDIFVKVYDILDTKEWSNAMLLFNSWKISIGPAALFDRGFKLGLLKHFELDVTLYDRRSMEIIHTYLSNNPYLLLKDNPVIDKDIQLLLSLYNEYVETTRSNKHVSSIHGSLHYLNHFASLISKIRKVEQNTNKKANSKNIPFELIKNLLNSNPMNKHLKKVNSMSVPGSMDNFIKRNMLYPTIIILREYYGITDKFPEEYMKYPVHFPDNPQYFFNSLKELDDIFEVHNKRIEENAKKEFRY